MTLLMDDHPGGVSGWATYRPARKRLNDPWANQMEGQRADLRRRIPALQRLIADLDQEVRSEEDRVKMHDPAHIAYSTYAKATASRRDNLRRSADELRAHLAKAKQALLELGVGALDA
jgi:flagellar FliJ protein